MIKVSKMTGKLEGLQGINTNPLDNKYCERMSKTESICKHCYSRKMVSTYRKSAAKCWSENGKELSDHILSDNEIPKIKADYIRFHAHGELINLIHYVNFKRIAFAYPDKTFALWTKRKDIINHKLNGLKPDNLTLIYSNPTIDKPIDVPQGFDKVFNVFSKDNDSINCAGKKCIDCLLCYNSDKKIINEVLR
jgi:hypothetical protein